MTTDPLTVAADALTDATTHLDTALAALRTAGMPETTRTKVAALACATQAAAGQVTTLITRRNQNRSV